MPLTSLKKKKHNMLHFRLPYSSINQEFPKDYIVLSFLVVIFPMTYYLLLQKKKWSQCDCHLLFTQIVNSHAHLRNYS